MENMAKIPIDLKEQKRLSDLLMNEEDTIPIKEALSNAKEKWQE